MKHLAFLLLIVLGMVPAHVQAITITLIGNQQSACNTATGALDITVTGGSPPYSYNWSNGATTEDIQNLAPGLYEVTVTDALSQVATGSWNVVSTTLTSFPSAQDGHASCIGQMGGRVQVIEWGINGTPPYTYMPPPDGYDPQGDPYFNSPFATAGTAINITVFDANGCSGTLVEYVMGPQMVGSPTMTLGALQGSCSGGTGGSVTVTDVYDLSFFGAPDLSLKDAQDNVIFMIYGAGNTVQFTDLAPGSYHVERDWDPSGVYMAYSCLGNPYDRIDFVIADLGPNCGNVSGSVFIDNDQDCIKDPTEVGVPFQVLQVLPGSDYTITGVDGHFSLDLSDGSYALAQTDPDLVQLCPVTAPVPFTIASNVVVIDLADSSTVPMNMKAELQSGPYRPGFNTTCWGRVRNTTPQLTGPVTLEVVLDPALVYISASPTPSSVAGNTLTWNLAAFTPYEQLNFAVDVSTPIGTPLGTLVSTTAEVSASLPEVDLGDNLVNVNGVVTGSYDPNDKRVWTSSGWSDDTYIIGTDEWLEYVVRFQNTGTDTAFTVVVTDTLDADLDMGTFEQGVASHPFTVSFKPDRVVEWRFANILLPDSNTNEALSHGLVSFRIRPVQPVLPGTEYRNNADIFFDFNPPIRTNDAVVIAETSTQAQLPFYTAKGELRLFPNPAATEVLVVSSAGPLGTVELIAMDGRLIRSVPVAGQSILFDLADVPSGVLLIRAVPVNGMTYVKRLIHQ